MSILTKSSIKTSDIVELATNLKHIEYMTERQKLIIGRLRDLNKDFIRKLNVKTGRFEPFENDEPIRRGLTCRIAANISVKRLKELLFPR